MPGASGSTLAHTLRERAPELPVVYVSGYAADRLGEDTLTDPKTEFVQKPFDLHDLIVLLDTLL